MSIRGFIFLLLQATLISACGNKKAGDPKAYEKSESCIEEKLSIKESKIQRIRKQIDADEKTRKIDSIFRIKQREGFNGNVLIAQKGVVLYQKSFGYGDVRKRDSLKNASRFQLASLSKTFTAVAVLMLHERGHLELSDTVRKYFPDFPYEGVSIRDLLSHRSGLPNYMYAFDDSLGRVEVSPDHNRIMHWLATASPVVKPYGPSGRGFAYNNTNYIVLATLIEKISGMRYGQFLDMAIFHPLGMRNTYAISEFPGEDSLRVTGHDRGRAVPKDFFDDVMGDKGIYSTAEDMYIWYHALNSECLLKKESLREAFTPRSFERPGVKNYGYGFRMYVKENKEAEYIYHNGWWKGFSSLFWFSPDDEFVIIILSNRYNGTVYRIKELLPILHGHSNGENVEAEIRD